MNIKTISLNIYSDSGVAEVVRVFVYGTLKPGESNFDRYCQGKVSSVQPAIVYGTLFHLSSLGYPALTTGHTPVYGYLLTFDQVDDQADDQPEILRQLDQLEDYDRDRPAAENEYIRQTIEILSPDWQSLGSAWVYRMALAQIRRFGGILLPAGVWSSAMLAQNGGR